MKDLIDKSGRSIPEIAKVMSITRQRVYQLIDDPKTMTARQVIKFAQAINVSPKTVISLIDDGK